MIFFALVACAPSILVEYEWLDAPAVSVLSVAEPTWVRIDDRTIVLDAQVDYQLDGFVANYAVFGDRADARWTVVELPSE